MIIAFFGDVVGEPGLQGLAGAVPHVRRTHNPDLMIANAENSAAGAGIDETGLAEMEQTGIQFFTTGNHVWDNRGGIGQLDDKNNIVRPANYPDGAPGVGIALVPGTDDRVAVINVQGRASMPALDCPFRTVDRLLDSMPSSVKVIVVDMHAQATGEKLAMGWYLDGRVSLVLGTHTHVPTRDARVLAKGTGYVTDVGMTGAYDSILGLDKNGLIERFLKMRPVHIDLAREDLRSDYIAADIDENTGKTRAIIHEQVEVK